MLGVLGQMTSVTEEVEVSCCRSGTIFETKTCGAGISCDGVCGNITKSKNTLSFNVSPY